MASCGEVDHSLNPLPSSKKSSGSGSGSGNSAESSCSSSTNPSPGLSVPECAICLQSCVHPVQLPCHHVFCFLCAKGASWQSKRCALCRQEIPDDFLERPTLLSPEELKASAGGRAGATSDHAWYYEGRNGWWQYDERTSRELEDAFSKGKKTAEMLIAGFLYVADLENMVQYRRNEHGRRRKIKRDVLDIPKKGVAGLRLDTEGGAGAVVATNRENSADGADTTTAGPQQQMAGSASLTTAPAAIARPPIVLGAQSDPSSSSSNSPTLEGAFSRLDINARRTPPQERFDTGEGEEEEEEETTTTTSLSRSSDLRSSVDESGSGDLSDDEEDEMGDAEPLEGRPQRQRLSPEVGAAARSEFASSSSSSTERSRMPDGQCTKL